MNHSLGGKIKDMRLKMGATLTDVSLKTGINLPKLSRIENNSSPVTSEELISLATYFSTSIDQLLDFQPSATTSINLDNFNLQTGFDRILKEYPVASKEDLKGHKLGNFVRNNMVDIIKKQLNIDTSEIKVIGSVGQGNWAEVPWIVLCHRQITESAQRGVYVVYLFKADCSGFYLSLNQGWTFFEEKYKGKLGRKKIKVISDNLRAKLKPFTPEDLSLEEIDLKGRGRLAVGYMLGHITGKYYPAESLPSSIELINDLKTMMKLYEHVRFMIAGRKVEEFNEAMLLHEDNLYFEQSEDEEAYQTTIEHVIGGDDAGEVIQEENDDNPEEAPHPIKDSSGSQKWPRDAKKAAKAIKMANFKCSYDESHVTFISALTGKPYIEAHHLVPLGKQDRFRVKLDKIANIVPLCPVCHRLIHLGCAEDKQRMVDVLYEQRREDLLKVGIDVSLLELRAIYGLN
ncbi:MrcB family domain-containing protein [Brevibacillus sp. HD1.4A]|uniref:MrcB family domain-containing protein n=1 Tax=Brevibacillus sp. HD1.4A TaxID=2738978 RepID=UPI00156BD074|nr:DUF3578 domain-containing protein [Brevibacillus sp. HD1.4A]